jgi:hypothetical protein
VSPVTGNSHLTSKSGLLNEMKPEPRVMPVVDEWHVKEVISGEYNLAPYPGELDVVAQETNEKEVIDIGATCPTGTRPCPQGCKSIHVWGLSPEPNTEGLRNWCLEVGHVEHLELLKPRGACDTPLARVTFRDSSAAQEAIWSLHRRYLDNKVR